LRFLGSDVRSEKGSRPSKVFGARPAQKHKGRANFGRLIAIFSHLRKVLNTLEIPFVPRMARGRGFYGRAWFGPVFKPARAPCIVAITTIVPRSAFVTPGGVLSRHRSAAARQEWGLGERSPFGCAGRCYRPADRAA